MNWWILQILNINCKLDKLCQKLDEKIQKLALNMAMPAAKVCDEICRLNGKKADLINLRVLFNMLECGLTKQEFDLIFEASKDRIRYLQILDSKRSEVFKDLDGVIKKCSGILVGAGYYSKRLERIYPYLALRIQAA